MIFDVRRMEEMVYIVVPIFNTEKYLEQCLKSIHKQTYQNWKCLLVNDGSTDGCSQICETFANGDSRYVYIYEENKGLSAARNKGIECAIDFSGGGHDFVCFVDSDDYIEPDYLEKMLEPYQANSSLDLVICNYFNDNVNVRLDDNETTEALARVLDILEANITPLLVESALKDGNA